VPELLDLAEEDDVPGFADEVPGLVAEDEVPGFVAEEEIAGLELEGCVLELDSSFGIHSSELELGSSSEE
jgi:hypothetical protein